MKQLPLNILCQRLVAKMIALAGMRIPKDSVSILGMVVETIEKLKATEADDLEIKLLDKLSAIPNSTLMTL